ncbi:MAG: class I SAM-dependent methyltransferase [Thermoplasmata archaeon]|nr:class I SAM-dependent methyltransferase [Thermoplasmata archaeon]
MRPSRASSRTPKHYTPSPPAERRKHLRRTFDAHVRRERERLRGDPHRELRGTLVERFLALHLAKGRGPILEIGPGTGRFSRTILAAGRPTILYDLSRPMLKAARQGLERRGRGAVRPMGYLQAAAEGLRPMRDRSAGTIVLVGLFGFFGRDVSELLEGARRVLRPGGILLLEGVSPSGVIGELFPLFPRSARVLLRAPREYHLHRIFEEGWQPHDPEHGAPWEFGFWRPDDLSRRLAQAGFTVNDRMSVGPLLGNQAALLKRLHRDRVAWANLLDVEERCGRLPECLGVGASFLVCARRSGPPRRKDGRSRARG